MQLEQSLKKYSHLPEEAQAQIKAGLVQLWQDKCKSDFGTFSEEILGFKNAPHQTEWCDILGNQNNRQIVVAAPRGHSKTTVFSVEYPLWEIARNQNVRILLVSAADTQSQSFLREIKGRIERDQEYVNFAGQLQPKQPTKWTDKEIIIKRDRTDLKDPTISTVSVEGTILSKRADIIICDDLLNFENSRTPEARQKIWDWFMLTLLPVLEPKTGRLVVAGTIWQVDDLMETLLADPTFDYRKKYRAIINEATNQKLWEHWYNLYTEEVEGNKINAAAFYEANRVAMDEGTNVLWPERVGYSELYILRSKDGYAFARAYQNDPASRPSQMIKREWIEAALAKGRNLKLQDAPHTEYIELTTEGVDLAISDKTTGDDTAKVTIDKLQYDWETSKAGDYIMRNIKRGKMTFGETKAMITTDFYAIRPHGIRVETVGYQEALARELNDSHIPVRGHRTGNEKWDSAVGVNSIGILLEQGKLVIPSDPHDARTKDFVGKLVAEMLAFPEGHTGDSLMALWFAVQEMMELMGTRYVMPKVGSETNAPQPAAPQNTIERVSQEKQADKDLVDMQEQQRSRAAFWKEEQRRVMNSGAKNAFMRR